MATLVIQSTMSPELVAACNALGYSEGNTYMKEPYCLETMKDLIGFLRRENDACDVRRQLGAAQILQNDLIPIVTQYSRQTELFETCIRLMVNLTQPVDLCFTKPENKGDKIYQSYQLEVLTHQQAYKEAFSDEEFMGCLAAKLKKLLEKPWEKRRDDDTLLMERILILIRNILHVPADPLGEKRTDDDVSVHDGVLWGMNTSGLDKLILYIASSEGEANWCIHAAEIISRMLREQSPEHIARAGTATATAEKKKEMAELEAIRIREREEKKARLQKLSSRHSRFGGTFQVKNLKSISDYDVIYHRTLPKDVNHISFELDKPPAKRPKHRLPMQETTVTRRSTLSIRMFLKDFCSLFLENCYNPLMYNVKDHILHQKAQENDDSYYLWLMRFFMEFNRLHQFHVDLTSETFSVQTFHYVQMQVLKYLEMLTTDKQETKNWARRLHIALKAYRELLLTLDAISSHEDETIRESAQVVQSNVFYVIEYREILLTLLKNYTDIRNTRSFLVDLVDATHLYLKMLERYCKGKKNVIVQKKVRRKAKRRKKGNAAANQEGASADREAERNDGWDNIAGDISAMVQDREDVPDNVVPFDAASEQPVEEQRSDAMIRIQQCLHDGQAGDAVALLRAAREVWPDGDVFGAADIDPEDEFMALREIHFTNLNVPGEDPPAPTNELIDDEMEGEDDEEDELQEENQAKAEEEFHFGLYVNQFTHMDILKNYIHLLEGFKKNDPHINHCIIKMMHRVCVDCDKTPKLFQLSLFYTFHQLFNDHLAKTSQYREMVKFGQFLMRRFFAEVPRNPKIFMEILFWKDNKEIFEISEGYGSIRRVGDIVTDEWEDSLKEELRDLFGRYNEVEGDKDVVDHIMEHLSNESKTRKQICRQLVNMDLVENIADLKRVKGAKRAVLWREEHIDELKELFTDYKDSDDVMGNIVNGMIQPRPRAQIVQKLLDLELISDKKEVHKKRAKGQGGRRKKGMEEEAFVDDREENENGAGSDSDDDGMRFMEPMEEPIGELPEEESDAESDITGDESSDEEGDVEEGATGEPTKENMRPMVEKLQKKGFREQILWIQEGLRVRAEDKDKDENDEEAVPVVPLEEKCARAIANKLFMKFLRRVGLNPPSDQETFWRIPGDLTPANLRERADAIDPPEETESAKKQRDRHRMLEDMAAEKKTKARKPPKKKMMSAEEALERVLESSTPQGAGEVEGSKGKKKSPPSKSRIKRPLDSESSADESDDEPLVQQVMKKNSAPSQPAKRSRIAIASDSEEEQEEIEVDLKNVPNEEDAPLKSSKKPSALVSDDDSDDDDDDDVPIGVLVQRKRTVLSDSESDED